MEVWFTSISQQTTKQVPDQIVGCFVNFQRNNDGLSAVIYLAYF